MKTWLFRILVYRARNAGAHEPRTAQLEPDDVLEGRFGASGAWDQPPEPWADTIDSRITADKIAAGSRSAFPLCRAAQRQVFTLRDIEEVGAADVCELLGLSEGNQRVLLHRARSRVRRISK